MAVYALIKDSEVVNRIVLDDDAIVLTPKEAKEMPLEWLSAWKFYTVEDDITLNKIHDEEV